MHAKHDNNTKDDVADAFDNLINLFELCLWFVDSRVPACRLLYNAICKPKQIGPYWL
jgi:hypothetical protein